MKEDREHPAALVREAQRYVRRAAKQLGLYEWNIEVSRTFADDGVAAQNVANQEIHDATIRLSGKWPTYDELYRRQTLVHEVLHIAMARIDRTVYDIRGSVPGKVWRLFEKSYVASVEPTIDRLSLVLEPFIE